MGKRSLQNLTTQIEEKPLPPLEEVYSILLQTFGNQGWWPADTPFEVCVGAILTQNTNWKNVERAISILKAHNLLDPFKLWQLDEQTLGKFIKPAGYYRIKTRRLKAFLKVLVEEFDGSLQRLFEGSIYDTRQRLLTIPGIGPETADSMLLYAANKPVFVVDAYTKRLFVRHNWISPSATYEQLQSICTKMLWRENETERVKLWQDVHAQFVKVGKEFCMAKTPKCKNCPLSKFLQNE